MLARSLLNMRLCKSYLAHQIRVWAVGLATHDQAYHRYRSLAALHNCWPAEALAGFSGELTRVMAKQRLLTFSKVHQRMALP
jgi:hypothetical protein